MKEIFDHVSYKCSKATTQSYSTSFSLGIKLLSSALHNPIYAIYGFVRFADEIVDSFHDYNKADLLRQFRADTYNAIAEGISLNPILNSFQHTVKAYDIDNELIDTFLQSMEMDLDMQEHSLISYQQYILGSAQVVGLMCLKVFVNGNKEAYERLKPYAISLGAAFQKINFLRDICYDKLELGRMYFPGVTFNSFTAQAKASIEEDIKKDLDHALTGIKQLPTSSRLGVYTSYIYYRKLFQKIKRMPPTLITKQRIRIPDYQKINLMAFCYIKHSLHIL
jgi:phytoene/squalene synthetase